MSNISNISTMSTMSTISGLSNSNNIKHDQQTNYSSTPSNVLITEEDIINKDQILIEQKDHKISSMMYKDIEDYIDRNMKEMHLALDELRISFEDEIKTVDGKNYF